MSAPEAGVEVNKFEQVSSDGHQMSLAGEAGGVGCDIQCMWGMGSPMYDVQGRNQGETCTVNSNG